MRNFARYISAAFILCLFLVGLNVGLWYAKRPYEWERQDLTYVNRYFGIQVTKREGWLRYTKGPLLPFSKRNLIEFRRFGKREQPDAIVVIGPVDNLKGKPYGGSLRNYARVSLESLTATKLWLKQGQIELTEIAGEPCAKIKVSMEIPKLGEMEGEYYLFIKGEKGFHIGYTAIPSEFDQYRDEAMTIIQSFRFLDPKKWKNRGKNRGQSPWKGTDQ